MQISPELVERAAHVLHGVQLEKYRHVVSAQTFKAWSWDKAPKAVRDTWRREAERVLKAMVPILREAMLGDEAIERAALALFWSMPSARGWDALVNHEKDDWRRAARVCIEAALDDKRLDEKGGVPVEGVCKARP